MAKTAYTWDQETRLYTGIRLARNKDSNGEYLIPGHSTWEPPPIIGRECLWDGEKWIPAPVTNNNEVSVWNGEVWEIKADYQKETYYDTETGIQCKKLNIGEEPKATWTKEKPIPFSLWGGSKWVFDKQLWLDAAIRPERDARITGVMYRYQRHEREKRLAIPFSDSVEKIHELDVYIQALCDLPETITFEDPVFPVEPE